MVKAQILPAVLLTLTITVLTGMIFPCLIWGFSQILFPYQANGSLIVVNGKTIGSELIGQQFNSPRYFTPRPSAAGRGYDPTSSGGTNLGPTSKKLILGLADDPSTANSDESFQGITNLAEAYRTSNELPYTTLLPADAVTRSASGLDPHISLRNAELQTARVAKERGLQSKDVTYLIEQTTEPRFLGIFGEPRVNVVKLNLALDELQR